jgi:DNA-binding SARP family transcriptional activator
VNNQPIEDWPSKKGKSIFAYLLLNHKKKIYRDILMDLFWRKSSPDSARNCLNVTIHGLRRILQSIDATNEYIQFGDERYCFNSEIEVRLDIEAFRKTWRKAQSIEHNNGLTNAVAEYEQAAEIYKGDFLEDEIYDSWSSLDRENLKEIFLVILDKISEFYMLNNNHQEAIRLCVEVIKKDNCREDIYRRLMLCYYRIGQRAKALKWYRECSKALKSELEAEPTNITVELYKKIKADRISI